MSVSAHQLIHASTNNEWYTPERYIVAARAVMGGIDCDPASNDVANQIIQATTYYTIATDGFSKDWPGRVWLNPPYGFHAGKSNQERWTRRLLDQYAEGICTEAILLVNAVTERTWFFPLWQFPICFTNHRIRFYNQHTEAGQPTHGNAFVYLGAHRDRFWTHFSPFGAIVAATGSCIMGHAFSTICSQERGSMKTSPAKYRKKPSVIEAVQFDPHHHPWPSCVKPWPKNGLTPRDMSWGYIETLEGDMHVIAGDYVITGIKGEKYPCKEDIFEATYERVD